MGFNANDREGGGDFVPQEALEAGAYPGRVVQLVLMGLQPQRPFQGQAKSPKEELYVGYELSHEFMNDADGNVDPLKPRWVGEDFPFYNLEADRAKSTLRYNAIDGQGTCGGDWLKTLAMPCNITLSKEPRKGKEGFTNYVQHVGAPMTVPGYEQPELVNPPRIFDIDEPDMEVFAKLPEWMRKKIATNLNFKGSALEVAMATNGDTPPPQQAAPTPAPQAAAPAAPPQPSAPPAPPMPNAAEG